MTHTELKAKRKSLDLSATQAASLVHVSERTWQRYEAGNQPIPGAVVELFEIKANRMALQNDAT